MPVDRRRIGAGGPAGAGSARSCGVGRAVRRRRSAPASGRRAACPARRARTAGRRRSRRTRRSRRWPVEAHLVDQLLEDRRIVGEEIDAPFPVVEADRAGDDLRDLAGVLAADMPCSRIIAARSLERRAVPVLRLAAPLVHRVEADVARAAAARGTAGCRRASPASPSPRRTPARRRRCPPRGRGRPARRAASRSSRTCRARRSTRRRTSARDTRTAATRRRRSCACDSASKSRRAWISSRSPLWPRSWTKPVCPSAGGQLQRARQLGGEVVRGRRRQRAQGRPAEPEGLVQQAPAVERGRDDGARQPCGPVTTCGDRFRRAAASGTARGIPRATRTASSGPMKSSTTTCLFSRVL